MMIIYNSASKPVLPIANAKLDSLQGGDTTKGVTKTE